MTNIRLLFLISNFSTDFFGFNKQGGILFNKVGYFLGLFVVYIILMLYICVLKIKLWKKKK